MCSRSPIPSKIKTFLDKIKGVEILNKLKFNYSTQQEHTEWKAKFKGLPTAFIEKKWARYNPAKHKFHIKFKKEFSFEAEEEMLIYLGSLFPPHSVPKSQAKVYPIWHANNTNIHSK